MHTFCGLDEEALTTRLRARTVLCRVDARGTAHVDWSLTCKKAEVPGLESSVSPGTDVFTRRSLRLGQACGEGYAISSGFLLDGEELDELGHAHLTGGRERALLALGSSASTLELDDRLVDGGTLTKPNSLDRYGLADAVHARDGLVLDRRIDGRIQQHDRRRTSESEPRGLTVVERQQTDPDARLVDKGSYGRRPGLDREQRRRDTREARRLEGALS